MVKNPPANAGGVRDMASIPGLGRSPGGGHGNPLQYSGLENPHGQRSLGSYSPWVRKESDMTEQLHMHSISNTHLRQGCGWGLHRVVQALSPRAEKPGSRFQANLLLAVLFGKAPEASSFLTYKW